MASEASSFQRPQAIRLAALGVAVLCAGLFMPSAASADAVGDSDGVWTAIEDITDGPAMLSPTEYAAYRGDLAALDAQLVPAVTARTDSPSSNVSFPSPDGSLIRFTVQETPLLEAQLAADRPEIRSYVGRGLDDPSLAVRFTITPLGLNASVRSDDYSVPPWYIDPALRGDTTEYVSYPAGGVPVRLPLDADHVVANDEAAREPSSGAVEAEDGSDVGLRTIRVALASDPSFAAFYGSDSVLAAKAAILNRVAGVYNDDLGVRLVLVDASDRLNFDTPERAYSPGGACGAEACYTEPATTTCTVDALLQNSAAIAEIVGDSNFDLGHLLLGKAGGGLAGYAEVGLDGVKGGGCTGSPHPVGDGFAIDYVAHEIGHQLGASHTFNACGGSSGTTAVEPGSGSTIMAYAGICGDNNLQPHSDPYLSQASIAEIHRTIDTRIPSAPSGNRSPVVTTDPFHEIPIRTPFELTATGSDPDGDAVSYVWEQNDVGDMDRALLDDGKVDGPLFRVFGGVAADGHRATGGGARSFPDLAQILSGATNASTGSCDPTLGVDARIDCFSEFLPTEAYAGNGTDSLNFRVTARDGSLTAGGVSTADVRLTLDQEAGPFLITSLASPGSTFAAGATLPVTWDVNGTDRVGLAPEVRILLSTDGGRTFDSVLTPRTPNNGSAEVTLPRAPASDARLRIEAVDNVFFDLSDAAFTIVAEAEPTPTASPESSQTPVTPGGTSTGGRPADMNARPDVSSPHGRLATTGWNPALPLAASVATLLLGATLSKRRRRPEGVVES